MNILTVLYYLLIRPLELVYELIFSVSYKLSGSPVLSIIVLSITVGILSLPLYAKADKLHKDASGEEKKLKLWKERIKKNFKGDEQVMMLQAYYRENHYHPIMMLRSSVSLLLQIPFFIAAYRMLSSSAAIRGTSFGPIADLGLPDGLIHIGAVSINLLPILMTLINIFSGTIYSRDMDRKSKIQLYVTALIFLVLLYDSPSGLVFYWTLNNVFSLLKNVVMVLIPKGFRSGLKSSHKPEIKDINTAQIFILYALCNSIFTGMMIPSDFLSGSVGDFLTNYRTISIPHFIWASFFICAGFYIVWGGIYYLILNRKKLVAGTMVWLLTVSLLNYFAFYRNNGDLNRYLYMRTYYGNDLSDGLLNLTIILLAAALIFIVFKNKYVVFKYIAVPALAAVTLVSAVNMQKITTTNNSYDFIEHQRDYPVMTLSSSGKNVVVIMLDRAVGRVTPLVMNEMPELYGKFDGFTYYSNSLSFGLHTNMGAPALFGGYEYTPDEMNRRDGQSLESKHNEALRVLPALFGANGYDVTVLDPSFAGYMEIPDLRIYDGMQGVNAYITEGIMNPLFDDMADDWTSFMERNVFSYSLRLSSPVIVRDLMYDDGYYNDLNRRISGNSYFQEMQDVSHASGVDFGYLNPYYSLTGLSSITNITDSEGSFVLMVNNSTHEPSLLSEPSYGVSRSIDNSSYDSTHSGRFTLDGMTFYPDTPEMMGQYQIQAAALLELGNWFDYLRENDIYDNTRIIIVSDHGAPFALFGSDGISDTGLNVCNFNCLMMVKDFDAEGFTVCDEFITNAETPVLALDGIITDPVNPFTGNPLVSELNNADGFSYFSSPEHNVTRNNGNTFIPGSWFRYNASAGDIYDTSAWSYEGEH